MLIIGGAVDVIKKTPYVKNTTTVKPLNLNQKGISKLSSLKLYQFYSMFANSIFLVFYINFSFLPRFSCYDARESSIICALACRLVHNFEKEEYLITLLLHTACCRKSTDGGHGLPVRIFSCILVVDEK